MAFLNIPFLMELSGSELPRSQPKQTAFTAMQEVSSQGMEARILAALHGIHLKYPPRTGLPLALNHEICLQSSTCEET